MPSLLFNGKFLSAPPTGVHRVAEEMIRAVDRRIGAGEEVDATLLHPRDATRSLPLTHIQHRQIGMLTWQAWEQADLPRLAGPGTLVNLCNLGPVMRRDAVTMIHDAQVSETPKSYSPAFRTYYKAVQPMLAKRHKAILTVSEYARRALSWHGVCDEAHVIPNGCDHVHRVAIDHSAVSDAGLEEGQFVLAQASTQSHKNIKTLIEAFRAPPLSQVTLALFGAVDPVDAYNHLPPNVRLLGRISDEALFSLMGGAVAFACPSLTEGFGLPPAEAMALGCPVIVAPSGALPEVCGDAAIYAEPDEPAEWAQAIVMLTNRSELRRDMAVCGRTRAASMTWDAAAANLLDFLYRLNKGVACAA